MPVSTKASLLVVMSVVMVWTMGSPHAGGEWSGGVARFIGALARYLSLAV